MRGVYLFAIFFSCSFLFGQTLCVGDPRPKSTCAGWKALSQLDSLMPERIWEQEFDIRVDRKAFRESIVRWAALDPHHDQMVAASFSLGRSHRYFLKATLSGDTCRIIDRYQEFEWSPFWKYPPRCSDLRALKFPIKEGE